MLMSKAQIFEKAVQKISLNRLIHRKTWDTTENSLEKARISAKTRWENVQGRKTGRSCNSYTIMRVFFTSVHKKWDARTMSAYRYAMTKRCSAASVIFVLSTVSSCQAVRMAYTDNCTIDSSIINDFRTIHILTKKSRFTPVVRLLFFCCQRTKEVQNHGKTLDIRRISDFKSAVSERGCQQRPPKTARQKRRNH